MVKTRSHNHPGGSTGAERRSLYAAGVGRIRVALEERFFLEAITLSESYMTDRLEARWAWKNGQTPQSRRLTTLGAIVRKLLDHNTEPQEATRVYEKAAQWAQNRNEALHEMFKHRDDCEFLDWPNRYEKLESVASEGFSLARKIDRLVRKLNKLET